MLAKIPERRCITCGTTLKENARFIGYYCEEHRG